MSMLSVCQKEFDSSEIAKMSHKFFSYLLCLVSKVKLSFLYFLVYDLFIKHVYHLLTGSGQVLRINRLKHVLKRVQVVLMC